MYHFVAGNQQRAANWEPQPSHNLDATEVPVPGGLAGVRERMASMGHASMSHPLPPAAPQQMAMIDRGNRNGPDVSRPSTAAFAPSIPSSAPQVPGGFTGGSTFAGQYQDKAVELKNLAMEHKDSAMQGASGLRELAAGVGNVAQNGIQNADTGDIDLAAGGMKKLANLLPFHPTVAAVFLVLLGIFIYVLVLTTADKIERFEVMTTVLYAAMSFMDLLRERLVYLTDNNLVYGEIMGRQFLTQPRELTLLWVWVPGSYLTGDTNTFLRVVAEMCLLFTILILTTFDNNSFKEDNDTGFEPETLGTLCFLLGIFTVIPTAYLCFKGNPMTELNKKKIPSKPGFEKYAWFFQFAGVLKNMKDSVTSGNLKAASGSMTEARSMLEHKPGGQGLVGTEKRWQGAMATGTEERAMAHGQNMGLVGDMIDGGLDNLEEELEDGGDYFDKNWEEDRFQRVNDNRDGAFEIQLGSPTSDWKAQVMPIMGIFAALGSALFYQGIEDGLWVWTRELDDGITETVNLNDRLDKAGKILMVFAWTSLSGLATQAFKDTDMEIKAKRKLTELELVKQQTETIDEATVRRVHDDINREMHKLTEAEPVGIMEGLKNAVMNPGWLCASDEYILDTVKRNPESGKIEPVVNVQSGKPEQHKEGKWLGMLWLTAVMANLSKYGVAARGAFFSWAAEEPKTFVFWYVWLEFALISCFICLFYGISFNVIARNPNLRANYVAGPADPLPPAPLARPRQSAGAPPPPLYLEGAGRGPLGLFPMPGYANDGFQAGSASGAPPPIFLASQGFAFGPPQPNALNLQPLPGYLGY